uniref:Uncharacterized protein n=1 Tax=Meloidogyne enterolobii TaxID=390850 RepID=A0A6V7UVW4_MELEN|nr:unnamed protein product [Meloidogyne enterolobii]
MGIIFIERSKKIDYSIYFIEYLFLFLQNKREKRPEKARERRC